MQPNNQNNGPARTQSIIITAITLFALSGLIIGFAVGAVTLPKQASKPTPVSTANNPIVQQTKPTPTVSTVQPVALGCPIIDHADGPGVADGTSTYNLQMHTVDKSGTCAQTGKPVQQPGITCKLWLAKDTEKTVKAVSSVWTDLNKVKQPIEGEVSNSLTFTSGEQTQMCNSQGQASWTFKVSPDVQKGKYFLIVLADWDGKFYNLSWWPFEIKQNS